MTSKYFIPGKMNPSVAKIWYKFYPKDPADIFRIPVLNEAKPHYKVLEIGAGSGEGDQQAFSLKGKVSKYVGIDLDSRVLTNPNLDEAYVSNASNLPFENNTFDLVFHTMVAEHLTEPEAVLRETLRIIKPGGVMLFETVNKFYYPMLIAAITPHWFHNYYIKRFASGRGTADVFPTVYKLNTISDIKNLCKMVGFSLTDVTYHSLPPGYLRSNSFLFSLGVIYERTMERIFRRTRGRIVVKCIK